MRQIILNLCYEIEKLPASEQQTKVITMASELLRLADYHPRAMKLMGKRKNFVVIAEDEPYFMKAYSLIREAERIKHTWTEEDEILYQEAFDKSVA